MGDVIEKHANEVDFIFIYCKEAHSTPGESFDTGEARNAQAENFSHHNAVQRTILIDAFDDGSVQKRYAALENSVFVLDGSGRILMKSALAEADELDAFLTSCRAMRATPHPDPEITRPTAPQREG